MIPVKIEHKFRGKIELPNNRYAKELFFRVKQAYANHENMGVHLLFNKHKLKKLSSYQKGGAKTELENIEFYIELGKLLEFDTTDAQKLKNSILLTNDFAHSHFNITKRLKLISGERKKNMKRSYLFWDIENFSAISSIFSEIIEPYNINDKNIYLAANPDSLYLKRAEWEANLYDYGKTLNSFNFIKCDYGKNVADDLLLKNYEELNIKNANIFLLTFDRELKERFSEAADKDSNLYIMKK
ncbi:hypothetical protein [Sulfurimonas marina]|uniref:Uncharacterized protein n=1 Tax=Sulfurimonas marina TaxID=2590551 RepID=A0A7M1ATA6_9BACT|nr:hypothetical protein [Sulfurimonas marina]QOP40649.1 hypothetical protein FJR03_02380 [Sulfurimonas marina]